MSRAARVALRLCLGGVLFFSLAGPGAGNVGGCGNSPPIADPVEHCRERSDITCRRELFSERFDDLQFAECRARIEPTCMGATWPNTCEPTPAQSDACITLLGRLDLVSIPSDQLTVMFNDCDLCRE